MKIIGFNASPRKNGSTARTIAQILESAAEAGAETQVFHAGELNISPCRGCLSCEKGGGCVVADGMQQVYAAPKQADALSRRPSEEPLRRGFSSAFAPASLPSRASISTTRRSFLSAFEPFRPSAPRLSSPRPARPHVRSRKPPRWSCRRECRRCRAVPPDVFQPP